MKKYDWKNEYNPIRRTAKRLLSGEALTDGRPLSDLIELDEHTRKCLAFEATLTDRQIDMLQESPTRGEGSCCSSHPVQSSTSRKRLAEVFISVIRLSKSSSITPIGDSSMSNERKPFCSRSVRRSSFILAIRRLNSSTILSASACPTGERLLLKSCAASRSMPSAMVSRGFRTLL